MHLCFFFTLLMLGPAAFAVEPAAAQKDHADLSPELVPLKAKYDADMALLNGGE